MIIPPFHTEQDTVKINRTSTDSVDIQSDSTHFRKIITPRKSVAVKTVPQTIDTTLVCRRNSIRDVTFYDPANFIKDIKIPSHNNFLISLVEKDRVIKAREKEVLLKSLKDGESIPEEPLHYDWILLSLVFIAFLFSIIRSNSKNLGPSIKFFHFRGMHDMAAHDTGGLFHWQSTLLNLVSFLIISLFIYQFATFNGLVPSGMSGFVFSSLSLGFIILIFTLRHIVCMIAGFLSGQTELFREYLIAVHQSYRLSAVVLFAVVVLISYTSFIRVNILLTTGIASLGLLYFLRVIRLFTIFINRNISIFYLILYLCALEILPVLIIFRYFKG